MTKLPERFQYWFESRGWAPYPHQLDVIEASHSADTVLLIAPTGGGKTLSGFLPGLIDAAAASASKSKLRMLYLSPLKALATDIHRNLQVPLLEMKLGLRCEVRTGDTNSYQRKKQMTDPPDMLLTTPESLALIHSYADAEAYFKHLDYVILDELHALADNKRGDLLALNLARLRQANPKLKLIALSATVAEPEELAGYLNARNPEQVRVINAYQQQMVTKAVPDITLLEATDRLPWSGHSGRYAIPEIIQMILQHQTSIVFVNTRAQAELTYQALQEMNHEDLPIALHHGSLDREHRLELEQDLANGEYRAVVATSSLDLGIDWGSVDLVVQIGPPKGVARLMQRIGRSNHQLDKASKAVLVPTNRMETIEALAAIDAITVNDLDNHYRRTGSMDVLIQHLTGRCCSSPAWTDQLFAEVKAAGPYRALSRELFDRALNFAATGGYALKAYEQFRKLKTLPDGRLQIASQRIARNYRMNIGTIVGYTHLKIRMGKRMHLGEVEERFIQGLQPGDTFLFSGRLLEFKSVREMMVITEPAKGDTPKIPAFAGGRLPLSGPLAQRVRDRIADRNHWPDFPGPVQQWLAWQDRRSHIPQRNELLVESFSRQEMQFLVMHPFAGKAAHHTLGMLMTQRMEKCGLQPMGFVTTDYSLAVWSLKPVADAATAAALLDPEIIQQELGTWLDQSFWMKRTFRETAVVAGLIDRQLPGKRKSGRQVTFSSDLIYDVLHQYEPDHVLLEATRVEAARGMVNSDRLHAVLSEAQGHHHFVRLERISPFAIPVILEVGKETIDGGGVAALLELESDQLVREAGME
ncbi:MAG: ligase-associated DNA damage response DEXH box helicase [Verrucomicrobiota bacterium]